MRNKKLLLIIATGLFIFGGFIIFIGVTTSLLHADKYEKKHSPTSEWEDKEYRANAEDIHEITTTLTGEAVTIETTNEDAILIKYRDDPTNPIYQITEKNGVLSLTSENNFTTQFLSVPDLAEELAHQKIGYGDTAFTIYVPADYAGSYDIDVVSGSITASDLLSEKDCSFDSVSGDIELKNIQIRKTVDIETVSGNTYIDDSSIEENLNCDSTSGNVIVRNIDVKEDIDFSTVSGYFEGETVSCSSLDIESTSGDTDITGCTIATSIHGDSVSGCFNIKLTDEITNYAVEFDTVSGSSNLQVADGGEKELSFSTTSGDINIYGK